MGAAAVIVLSIAALDSLNPSTIAPAAVLAIGANPVRRVAAFTVGVFLVSTVGGLVLLFALGRTFLERIAHPSAHTRALVELVVGAALLAAAALAWVYRGRARALLVRHGARGGTCDGRSSFLLGAGIMAVELPTAFPYFAAILVTLGAHGPVGQTLLVVLYNLVFVLPLVGLTAIAATNGGGGRVARLSDWIRSHGPVVVPVGVACIGAALTVVGLRGL